MSKELNFQEQAFMALYLQSFNAPQSALGAGYAESVARVQAWSWVSITSCPPNKRHLRDAIQAEISRIYGEENIDKGWIKRRAKILAEFNLGKFITTNDEGEAFYDFSTATHDDWWCIEEFTTERVFQMAAQGKVPVEKMKIKTASKIAALKLLGDHVDVAAFKQQVEHTGQVTQVTMTADELIKYREQLRADDDC